MLPDEIIWEDLVEKSVARRAMSANPMWGDRKVRNVRFWSKYYLNAVLGAPLSSLIPRPGVNPRKIPKKEPKTVVNEFVKGYAKRLAEYSLDDIKDPARGARLVTDMFNDAKTGNIDRSDYLRLMKKTRQIITDARKEGKYGKAEPQEAMDVKDILRELDAGPRISNIIHPLNSITNLLYPLTPGYYAEMLQPRFVKTAQKWWRRATPAGGVGIGPDADGVNGGLPNIDLDLPNKRRRGERDTSVSGDGKEGIDSPAAITAMSRYTQGLENASGDGAALSQRVKEIREEFLKDPRLETPHKMELDYLIDSYMGYEIDIETNPYEYFDVSEPKKTFRETFSREDSSAERYSKYVSAIRSAGNETELSLIMRAMARDPKLGDSQKQLLRQSVKLSLGENDKDFADKSGVDNLLRITTAGDNTGDKKEDSSDLEDADAMAMAVDAEGTTARRAEEGEKKQVVAPSVDTVSNSKKRKVTLDLENYFNNQLSSANSARSIDAFILAITQAARDGKITSTSLRMLRTKAMSKKKAIIEG